MGGGLFSGIPGIYLKPRRCCPHFRVASKGTIGHMCVHGLPIMVSDYKVLNYNLSVINWYDFSLAIGNAYPTLPNQPVFCSQSEYSLHLLCYTLWFGKQTDLEHENLWVVTFLLRVNPLSISFVLTYRDSFWVVSFFSETTVELNTCSL